MSVVDGIYPPTSAEWKPERQVTAEQDAWLRRMLSYALPIRHRTRRGYWPHFLGTVQRSAAALAGCSDAELAGQLRELLGGALYARDKGAGLPRLFGLLGEYAARHIGLRPFDVQLIGARCLLDGKVVEMDTGEGKTLIAALAAAAAALHGVDVHVITVNDFLTERDAEFARPFYAALGLDVGTIMHGMQDDARQHAYACAITYCTNKEVAFDYLRDRIRGRGAQNGLPRIAQNLYESVTRGPPQVQRGLSFAIVDEADSVLIDEARSPLIISGQEDNLLEQEYLVQALELAKQLEEGRDFRVDHERREVKLLDSGRLRLAELSRDLGPLWKARRRAAEVVDNALTALHLHQRDNHYIVDEGKVQIVDEHTGRVLDGRRWERGIHQMIELKEGVKATAQTATIDRISYQDFFRRYLSLCGMTGTAREVARELHQVYGLKVVRVPTNRPARRQRAAPRVLPDRAAKFAAICAEVDALHRAGKPVLIGTRTVEDSEALSERLNALGLTHRVLNAKNHKEEAEIVARSGEVGHITVATNMAGRGTDIKISPAVATQGGLHVILTEMHESRRIDRQLIGRCGRQGDPGNYQAILSLEDMLFRRRGQGIALPWRLLAGWPGPGRALFLLYARWLQSRVDARNAALRRRMLRYERNTGKMLFFTGARH